jgi:hypothetical protein
MLVQYPWGITDVPDRNWIVGLKYVSVSEIIPDIKVVATVLVEFCTSKSTELTAVVKEAMESSS